MTKKPTQQQLNEAAISNELQEEAARLSGRNQVLLNRADATARAREVLFLKDLDRSLIRTFSGRRVTPPTYRPRRKEKTTRALNLLLSDLHFGAALDGREVAQAYGPAEEARRLAAVVQQTVEFKRQHRDSTVLNIHLAGDIIQNQLHDQRDGTPLAEQSAAAISYLVQAVAFCAGEFKQVNVRCTTGNHGRIVSRHKSRATHQKWDSIETIIYYALKAALSHLPHVFVDIPYSPFYTYDSFGKKGMVTHGDTVIRPGFPGSGIKVGEVRSQINEFNAPLGGGDQVSLFAVGHVHTASVVHMGNGTVFVSNGALVPPDSFAGSIGIHEAVCGQQLWESVPGFIFGDHRFLHVDASTDKDAALEKIIRPFKEF